MKLGELRESFRTAPALAELAASKPLASKVNDKGDDALLLAGKYKGWTLKAVVKKDRGYLEQLIRSSAPDNLREVARYILSEGATNG